MQKMLIHAFMASRLDYCNALLGGYSARLINKLQMVKMQQLESLLEPGSMTTLARFCQHCTGSLLTLYRLKNLVNYLYSPEWFSSLVLERALISL